MRQNTISSFGLTIPNTNLKFECLKTKMLLKNIYIITKHNEILVYSFEDNSFSLSSSCLIKKHIIMTSMENRPLIIDLFLIDQHISLLSFESQVLIIISSPLIISYHNISDGFCFSKINLASFIIDDEVMKVYCLQGRFMLIICNHKAILYDCYTQMVIKEEEYKFRKEKSRSVTQSYHMLNENPKDKENKGKDRKKQRQKQKEEEQYEYESFELKEVYQIKSNSFYLLSKDKKTYFLNVPGINEIQAIGINYADTRIRIIKQLFKIDKYLNNKGNKDNTNNNDGNDSIVYFSNEELCAHYNNQRLYISFLNSVEELTELSTYTSNVKSPIKFLQEITIDSSSNHLIAIHGNFIAELFTYDKNLREIRLERHFNILIDESDIPIITFLTSGSLILAYSSHSILIYNLSSLSQAKTKELLVPMTYLSLSNEINGNRINFTKYFTANFSKYLTEIHKSLGDTIGITASVLFSHVDNKSLYYILGTNEGKVAIIDVFFSETMLLSPLIMIDHSKKRTAPISSLTIYDSRILIIASEDGMVSLTEIGLQKIEAAINMKKKGVSDEDSDIKKGRKKSKKDFNYLIVKKTSMHNKKDHDRSSCSKCNDLPTVYLMPFHYVKNYYPLKRIMSVIPLNSNNNSSDNKQRMKYLIGLETKDNSISIMKMDTYEIMYYYNSPSLSSTSIQGIYHLHAAKSLLLYLSNNTIRLVSYLTKTVDRIITNISTIYNIMQIDINLNNFFPSSNTQNINDYVVNISKPSLKYNEASALKSKNKNNIDSQCHSNLEITIESIEQSITNETQKELFIKKYYQNTLSSKQYLNSNGNASSMIIDNIISIITSKENEKLKKIQIVNYIYNPHSFIDLQSQSGLFTNEKEANGVLSQVIEIGEQYAHCISFDYDQYFNFIETIVKHHSSIDGNIGFRTNYFNWIALFHIWNFSVDLDAFLFKRFKLTQPILDFKPVLFGVNGACSLLLNETIEIGEDSNKDEEKGKFSKHFDFYLNYVNTILHEGEKGKNEGKEDDSIEMKMPMTISEIYQMQSQQKELIKKVSGEEIKIGNISPIKDSILPQGNDGNKKELFLNKTILLESYQPFLTNIHNYQISSTTSHHMHLHLFGSLISLLGSNIPNDLCDFIDSLKKIMKILSSKHLIHYSNMTLFHQFTYNKSNTLSSTTNNLLLIDNFTMHHTLLTSPSKPKHESILQFKSFLDDTIAYLSKVYQYIFNLTSEDMIYYSFPHLNRKLNLDACAKLEFLSSYELSLVSFILTYNSIAVSLGHNKLQNDIAIKACELLILFIFKIINHKPKIEEEEDDKKRSLQLSYVKIIIDQLDKAKEIIEEIYMHNMANYTRILIDFYTYSITPIHLDSNLQPFKIGNIKLIKCIFNLNLLKILLAKHIKSFSKSRLSHIIKFIVDEFKSKPSLSNLDYYTFIIELLCLLLKERHVKLPQYLPTIINLLLALTNSKDLKPQCITYAKKTMTLLLAQYPMLDYNEATKRYVIGGSDGKVYVYDADGTLWKSWTAHDKEITAVVFDAKGGIILTYSSTDCNVKFWSVNFTNFLSNLFALKDGYYKIKKLGRVEMVGYEIKIAQVKMMLIPHKENEIVLNREDNSVEIFKL